jgi:manganese/zinc/iron transport system substrate-binding protein
MNKFLIFTLIVLLQIGQTSCSSDRKNSSAAWFSENGKIKILTTTAMIQDLVQRVGGDRVDVIALINGELDPHSYQLVKGDGEKITRADLIFANGLGLEHGPSLQTQLESNPKAVPLGNWIMAKEPELIVLLNGQIDPHIWMDISLWKKTVPYIVEYLTVQDPTHADQFKANGEALMAEMEEAHRRIRNEMQEIPAEHRYLVSSHDAFNYFTRSYLADSQELVDNNWQKRFAAPEGLAPDSQLSAIHIQEILNHLKKYKIKVIFPESNVSKDSIRKIVSAGTEMGLQLTISQTPLYADAMGAPGSDGDTYIKMIQHNARVIADEFKHVYGQQGTDLEAP